MYLNKHLQYYFILQVEEKVSDKWQSKRKLCHIVKNTTLLCFVTAQWICIPSVKKEEKTRDKSNA